MDKIQIKIKKFNDKTYYTKACPFGVICYDEKINFEFIKNVGSIYCQQCKNFIAIKNNFVYCD